MKTHMYRINEKRPGQLCLTNDPPVLCKALGRYYGRHAATMSNEERQYASAMMIEAANNSPSSLKRAIIRLRAQTVATIW